MHLHSTTWSDVEVKNDLNHRNEQWPRLTHCDVTLSKNHMILSDNFASKPNSPDICILFARMNRNRRYEI